MQEDDRQLVIQALGSLPAERFAVVDGAHFDDLPKELDVWKLEYKALYLEKLGETPSTAGPYLVMLPDWEAANRVLSLVGDLPAVVFWSWPDGQPSLFKHLRRINMIEIPVDDYDPEMPKYDRVLFRHGDPNVMASMLSVLDEDQFSQVLGGAAGLVMFARDEGGLRVAQRISDMGSDRQGILRLSPVQMEALAKRQIKKLEHRTFNYLKRNGGMFLDQYSDESLFKQTKIWVATTGQLGLKSEKSVWKWCFLELSTGGRLMQQPGIPEYLKNGKPSWTPDRCVDHLMKMTIKRLRGKG